MYFEPFEGYQPSEDTTVVKQYGLSSQNKRKYQTSIFTEIQIIDCLTFKSSLYVTTNSNFASEQRAIYI
jgi:hypothetical protein